MRCCNYDSCTDSNGLESYAQANLYTNLYFAISIKLKMEYLHPCIKFNIRVAVAEDNFNIALTFV